jgi:hypothetical protein
MTKRGPQETAALSRFGRSGPGQERFRNRFDDGEWVTDFAVPRPRGDQPLSFIPEGLLRDLCAADNLVQLMAGGR